MERVAFLVEETGEHISCLLNPEAVVMTRTAGLRERRSSGGRLTGTGLADDPVLLTGGGRTELRLDLLFDVDLVDAGAPRPADVRDLTRPLWDLSENPTAAGGRRPGAPVRFVWGRAWNVPGIVASVAERFDRFDAGGAPLRSWLRLLFLRTRPLDDQAQDDPTPAGDAAAGLPTVDLSGSAVGAVLPVTDGSGDPSAPELPPGALETLSMTAFGTPFLWKELLAYNGVDDPRYAVDRLDVPPLSGPTA